MDSFTPEKLFQAMRESGLYSAEQLSVLVDQTTAESLVDLPQLSEKLRGLELLTAYQAGKLRRNRILDLLIGQYLVLDKIGEGGMGRVYKAVQCRTGRVVALKVVRQQLLTQRTVLQRFKREVTASAKLHHPNIVALLDSDEDQGRHFLAMEFVYGSDLSRLVKECGPLPYPEAAEYIRQSALGLQHAHEQNLVHRDIKPSNLLVSGERALPETGGVAAVRILDMGLVRSLVEEEDASRSELTRDGTVVGTPDYMAPEQAKNSSTVDARADIYSLGCTIFFLLTGKPPFPDGSPIDKLLRHQLDPPPEIRPLRPDVPSEMIAIIARLMAKDPKDRPQRASDVAALFQPFTPEGIANTPEIILTMPTPPSGTARGRATEAPAPVIYDAEIVEAEPVATPAQPAAPKPTAKQPIKRKKAVMLKPRESDSNEILSKTSSTETPRKKDSSDAPESSEQLSHSSRTRNRDDDSTVVAKKRPSRNRPSARKSRSLFPIATAVGGLLLLGIAALVFFSKPKPDTKADGSDSPNANRNLQPKPVPPTRATLPPAWVHIPDGTTAFAIAHPATYWPTVRDRIDTGSKYARFINRLAANFQFDLRVGERYTCSFANGKSQPFLATVEGAFLTAEWIKSAERWPGVQSRTESGQPFWNFPASQNRLPHFAAVSPSRGYLLSSEESLVNDLLKRPTTTPPKIDPGLLAALPDANGPKIPAFAFAATGDWQLPNGKRLIDLGPESVAIRAYLNGDKFDVEVEVSGTKQERVRDFVNISLWKVVNKDYPNLKPFFQAITEHTANDGWEQAGNLHWLKKSQPDAWTIASAHELLEQLLAE